MLLFLSSSFCIAQSLLLLGALFERVFLSNPLSFWFALNNGFVLLVGVANALLS